MANSCNAAVVVIFCVLGCEKSAPDHAAKMPIEVACEDGDPVACSELGILYAGDSTLVSVAPVVERDDLRAVQLLETACATGIDRACAHLGTMYAAGRGVAKDESRAATLFRQSCQKGDSDGCYNYALVLWDGIGVSRDRKQATDLLTYYCDLGFPTDKECEALARLTR